MLELGGNNPLVVLNDADLDQAVSAAVAGRFLHQGELCVSPNRIIVESSVHDAFVEEFARRLGMLKFGDPNDAGHHHRTNHQLAAARRLADHNILHLQQLQTLLDSPPEYGIRIQYLGIGMTIENL